MAGGAVHLCKYAQGGRTCPLGCLPHRAACHYFAKHGRCRYGAQCRKVHCAAGRNVDGRPIAEVHGGAARGSDAEERGGHSETMDSPGDRRHRHRGAPAPPAKARPTSRQASGCGSAAPPTVCRAATSAPTSESGAAPLPLCYPHSMSYAQALAVLDLPVDSDVRPENSVLICAVHAAFRRLALAHHPDRAGDAGGARTAYVVAARDILMRRLRPV